MNFLPSTMVSYCNAAERTLHSSKAKKIHICPFMAVPPAVEKMEDSDWV